MKKRIRIAILLTLAVLILATTALLGACSKSSPSRDWNDNWSDIDSSDKQIYIRNDSLNLSAKQKDLSGILDQITELANSGEAMIISRYSSSGNKGMYSASITYSVPNEKVDDFVAAVKKIGCKVESEHYDVQNVTNRNNIEQAQIAALQYKLEQYTKLQEEEGLTQQDKISLIEQIADIKLQLETISSYNGNVVTDRTTVSIYLSANDTVDAGAIVGIIVLVAVFVTAIFFVFFLSIKTEKQRRTITTLRTQVTAPTKNDEQK